MNLLNAMCGPELDHGAENKNEWKNMQNSKAVSSFIPNNLPALIS